MWANSFDFSVVVDCNTDGSLKANVTWQNMERLTERMEIALKAEIQKSWTLFEYINILLVNEFLCISRFWKTFFSIIHNFAPVSRWVRDPSQNSSDTYVMTAEQVGPILLMWEWVQIEAGEAFSPSSNGGSLDTAGPSTEGRVECKVSAAVTSRQGG